MSPRPVDSSVGVPRMTRHVRQRRSSESASLRKRMIKDGSAMALQLEVGVRERDLLESVQPYRAHHLVPHIFPPLRWSTLVHHPRPPWGCQPHRPRDCQRQRVQSPTQNRRQICESKHSLARARMCRDKVPYAVREVHHGLPDVSITRKSTQRACLRRRPPRVPVSDAKLRLVTGRVHLLRTQALLCMPMWGVQGLANRHSWRLWKASQKTIVTRGNAPTPVYLLHLQAVRATSMVC